MLSATEVVCRGICLRRGVFNQHKHAPVQASKISTACCSTWMTLSVDWQVRWSDPLFFFFFKILPPSDNRRRHMWSLQLDGPTDTTTAEPEFPHNTQFWCWRAKNAQGGKQARSVRYMCQYTVASVTEVCVRMHLPLRNMASAETTQSAFESVMGKDRGLGKAVLWASSCVFARSFPM